MIPNPLIQFNEQSEPVPLSHFDFAEIDRRLGCEDDEPQPESNETIEEALLRLFDWVLDGERNMPRADPERRLHAVAVRVLSLVAYAVPSLTQGRSLDRLASDYSLHKSSFSKMRRTLLKRFPGLKPTRCLSPRHREALSQSKLRRVAEAKR